MRTIPTVRLLPRLPLFLMGAILYFCKAAAAAAATDGGNTRIIVVIGSVNADTFLTVRRLPAEGENLTTLTEPETDVPGGKGCTQAVAVAKLLLRSDHATNNKKDSSGVVFVGQFGNDVAATHLRTTLREEGVDISHSGQHSDMPSGRGYVFLSVNGQVSAVVSGGANVGGWKHWERHNRASTATTNDPSLIAAVDELDALFQQRDADQCIVMLQREVPEFVNLLVAKYCKSKGVMVIQDVGGEDRPISAEMLRLCDYIVPNESELRRLVQSLHGEEEEEYLKTLSIVEMAKILQHLGARNVLVTQGNRGSTLVCEGKNSVVLHQPACTVLPHHVVDETGAGDCYRAGFAVALQEGQSLLECMEFATAAGACSVTKRGAVPSTPTRDEVYERLRQHHASTIAQDSVLKIPRGDGLRGGGSDDDDFPFLIGSRLNSMKDRPEVWGSELVTPRDYVKRQAAVPGLTCVDFNYPQHFHTWSNQEARAALDEAGLVAGAVCLRYPTKFARGAMNHPDAAYRREAIQLTKEAAHTAMDLGCNEVVVWSAYDGYDYPFQSDYDTKWKELVEAFQECCDAFPDIRFSLEYKPTDENTRFFTVPSTGAALLLVNQVDRTNFGLTLDVGHMLMSGENPGQSIAMVGRAGKLFGIQLNDGFTRLAAEDGLMFGSVHPSMALEIMYQLRRTDFAGHLYFDTFPQRTDPVREAEYNIRRVKAFWRAAAAIDQDALRHVTEEHDAVGALELVNKALRNM